MGISEEMKRPKWMLLSSDLAKAGIKHVTCADLFCFVFFSDFMQIRTAAKPTTNVTLTMFEPKILPTERGAPPEKAATKATVNSGREVENAIKLNPIAVFPSWVILATLTELLIAMLEARFNTTKENAMTKRLKIKSENIISATLESRPCFAIMT